MADHVGDLLLLCCARAHDGLLDLGGRVLPHREPRGGAGGDGRASCLGRGDGRAGVLAEEDLLDGKIGGTVCLDDLRDLAEDAAEAHVDGLIGRAGDASVGTGAHERAARLDHTPTGVRETGVDAEDDHGASNRC